MRNVRRPTSYPAASMLDDFIRCIRIATTGHLHTWLRPPNMEIRTSTRPPGSPFHPRSLQPRPSPDGHGSFSVAQSRVPRDLHRAEFGAAHRAEMRDLVRLLLKGLAMEALSGSGMENESDQST